MQLFYAPASPYSAKVRMAAARLDLALESLVTDTNAPPLALLQNNPLGKIPVLVDERAAVFDSRVILRHFDRLRPGLLFPDAEAERLEALADGICDCLLAHVYERRARPPEKVHTPWLERQWSKAERALAALNAAPPALEATAGTLALRAALGYLALRFPGQWEPACPALVAWSERFDAAHPALIDLLPS